MSGVMNNYKKDAVMCWKGEYVEVVNKKRQHVIRGGT